MKKFIAMMLCLAILVSAVALTISAAEPVKDLGSLGPSVADKLRPYGITPTFVEGNVATAPVMDGVVNPDEYTSKRVMGAKMDNGVALEHEVNFGGGVAPGENQSVTEYVAQDEDNIYVAFVYTEDVVSIDWRYNLSQSAIFDGFAIDNCGGIMIKLPQGTDYMADSANAVNLGNVTIKGGKGINNDSDFSFKTLKYGDNPISPKVEPDEFDAVAKRNYDGTTFKNVTAEFRLSKEAVMKATKEEETEIKSIGYYCKADRPGKDSMSIILQTFLPEVPLTDDGYSASHEFLLDYSEAAAEHYDANDRMVRYICFYADTYEEGQPASTMPEELLGGATLATQATTDPVTDDTDDGEEEVTTTEEEEEEETTTKPATTASTTAVEEKGCKNSIALSALAIVPVLGLGVAVVSKKKED